jgi:hypothetical protein
VKGCKRIKFCDYIPIDHDQIIILSKIDPDISEQQTQLPQLQEGEP